MSAGAAHSPGLPPRVLTVAGTHSGGGAGIEMDLRVLARLGAWGMTAITAVNAQNTRGCHRSHPLPPEAVAGQMEAVLGDIGADAVKCGQLATGETVRVVAGVLRRYPIPHRVVDPVVAASAGAELLDASGREALVRELLPLTTVLTPNWPEAAILLGRPPIQNWEEAREACRALHALGAQAVVLKGGHAAGAPTDLLYDGQGFVEFPGTRIASPHSGGTGCAFASALAAYLAGGRSLVEAVAAAKELVTTAIAGGLPLGAGRGPANPLTSAPPDRSGPGTSTNPGTNPSTGTRLGPGTSPTTDPGSGGGCDTVSDIGPGADAPATPTLTLAERLRLYFVAGSESTAGRPLPQVVAAAIAGGVTAVQFREKRGTDRERWELGWAVREICRRSGTLLIVNDRVDLALALEADGVHLGQDDLPVGAARRLLGPKAIIGVSVETEAEARAAAAAGASYLGTGPIYPTATKPDAGEPYGPAIVARIRAAVPGIPVVAIGGITAAGAGAVWQAGAAGLAVAAAIGAAADPAAAVRELLKTWGN